MKQKFRSLSKIFEEQVEKTPNEMAVSCGTDTISYQELNRKANQMAHYLQRHHDVGSEVFVALYLDRSVECIIALLGILKSGGAYVPIDSNMPPEQVNLILNDCMAHICITREELDNNIEKDDLSIINVDSDWPLVGKESTRNPAIEITEDNLLYIIYTSGLTGHPKAVQGTYRGIMNRLAWARQEYPFAMNEVACQRISISFVDHVAEIFSPLLAGTALHILSNTQAHEAEELVQTLGRKKITRITLSPSLLRSILSVPHELVFHLPYLKYVFCSGEALSTSVASLFYQRFKSVRLINIYGTTEVSADVTWYEVKRFDVDNVLSYFSRAVDLLPRGHTDDHLKRHSIPIGNQITTPNVPVDELAEHFTNTEIAEYPVSMVQYFDWFAKEVTPYLINIASPLYIGHMTSALPDFVHDMSKLISQMNQNMVKVETAKSAIFVEREALAMLHKCFYGLSDTFYEENIQTPNRNLGLVTSGGSISNITALMIARNQALARLSKGDGLESESMHSILQSSGYKDLVILGSKLMHYSMQKAAMVLGIGKSNIIYVDFDSTGALDAEDLKKKLDYCKHNGLLVFAMVGIAGATETGHIDPLEQMADIADTHDIYFHVDAAWGGAGLFSDRYLHRFKGVERAQSITFCAHKQFYLPQGISMCLFRDPDILSYGATTATYQAAPDSYDTGRFSLEGSRSAIALLLHASLQLIGRKGYGALFNASIDKAVFVAGIIKSLGCFELLFDPPMNIVNYRYIPESYRQKVTTNTLCAEDNLHINAINAKIQETQFLQGSTFASKTTLTNTRYGNECQITVFRVIIANPLTTQADIFEMLENQLMIANVVCGDKNIHELEADKEALGITASLADAFSESIIKEEDQDSFIPIGKPLPNCSVYILDENLKPVAKNKAGEIYIGGSAVSKGYFHQEEKGGDRFLPDPFADVAEATMFRTGDRGRELANGHFEYFGRVDDLVKIGENRIEISEVESLFLEIPHIKHCAILVEADKSGTKYLVAYLEFTNNHASSKKFDWVKEFANKRLQEKMRPRAYRVLDKMPLTLGGKIKKNVLLTSHVSAANQRLYKEA
ncbi:MAG: Unknown protein [uncultured Thiotrichaceae bacterium]|uniref:AMP-dependent synthetase/ligase domain-containing protein n=1 Tax=uncultured Thiotrichaceae bacterium TaxID=298394 RepID=A0A6S6U9L1_9GAMM|nr:MAG: Unknown protein [uncultured Thiotrichaceae bacterium]